MIATSAYAVIASLADATGLSEGGEALLVPLAEDAEGVFALNGGHLVPVGDPGHCAVGVDDEGPQGVELDG